MILGSPATQQISKSQTFDYWISDIAWLNLYDKMVKFPIWPHPHLLFLAGPDFDGELTALDQQLGVCKRCHAFSMIFSHVGQNSLFFLKNWDISHFESGGWLPNLETPGETWDFRLHSQSEAENCDERLPSTSGCVKTCQDQWHQLNADKHPYIWVSLKMCRPPSNGTFTGDSDNNPFDLGVQYF